jgi:hypothetical protein
VEREWQWANAIAQDFDGEQITRAVALLEAITQKMQTDDRQYVVNVVVFRY